MIIYKTTNLINDKIYIGQKPSMNTEEEFFNSNYYGSGRKIKNAIKEFGEENFKREIIDSSDDLIFLSEKEEYWIDYYNATDEKLGYNIAKRTLKYFFTGCHHTDESKMKNSKSHIGMKNSTKTKEKISKKAIERFKNIENHPMFNKQHKKESIELIKEKRKDQIFTEETRRKMSENNSGDKNYFYGKDKSGDKNPMFNKHHKKESCDKISIARSKKIEQYDLNDNFIKEYKSVKYAIEDTGITSIYHCLNGKYKMAGGFLWKYSK